MATLAFSLAGQFVGGLVGGPFGALLGRAAGALAGSVLDDALFGDKPQQKAPPEFRLQGSVEGGPIPRLYGWSRLTGNIIWATELEELDAESSGSKGGLLGGPDDGNEPMIVASFAVALCEGDVHRLGRIWADGQPLETEGLTIRFYRGTQDQGVDSLIEAKQGSGNTPAYRGLCYLVFERLPIAPFGNRIPNISVELCRVVGELEPAITAVTVIPGATEFGYDPTPRVRIAGPGVTANENTHLGQHVSDWTLSLDELQALCPNLQHVALVVAWFGDDLRCNQCTIRPKVENTTRVIEGVEWAVDGVTRGSAQVISTYEGGPAYGGTPSDGAVLAAIADLKARGLAVTLYPLVMMDIATGNSLPNPYGGTGQPAYPWRGRITCDPAPDVTGTPEHTSAVTAQVDAFVGTSGDWGYRRMRRHYAEIAVAAGGVDAFILGSEMRGLSFLRNGSNGFPFVDALVTLAGEVRSIVGAGTRITYGADWSEFAGLQPAAAPGDKYFHLDALWASSDIDAIGIDNYMPLADWRDGTDHADALIASSTYELDYLRGNIAGGEGYDWFYASDADRIAGTRTPIADGTYGEPWVWRYKDLIGWWSNAHHDRIGGVRQTSATAWAPQSKPIWFTELGCAATDKGANQPNIFGDPKSSENGEPFFSNGAPDGLMQRQFLRAHLGYWQPGGDGFDDAQNPVSGVYGERMLDPERAYLWTWDARPYPAFPADATAWADAVNHPTGHWLTGRLGAAASDEIVRAIGADYGVSFAKVVSVKPLVHGLVLEGAMPARDALAPVADAAGLAVRDDDDGLVLGRAEPRLATTCDRGNLAATDRPLISRRRPDPGEAVVQVGVTYTDRERGYLVGTATALRPGTGSVANGSTLLVLDQTGARTVAERRLTELAADRDTLEIRLPPSAAAYEVGDVVALGEDEGGPFEITEIRDAEVRRISARAVVPELPVAVSSDRPTALTATAVPRAMPVLAFAHVPPAVAAPTSSRLLVAAVADPWPGPIVLRDDATGSELGRVLRPGHVGELTALLAPGPAEVWDDRNELSLTLYSGHLASADDGAVLAGANRLAVQKDDGQWEMIGFAQATLTAPQTYVLSRLLRAQAGTDHALGTAAAGNRVIVIDERVAEAPVPAHWLGETLLLHAYAGRSDADGTALSVAIDPAPTLPLRPAHASARRAGGTDDVTFAWTRRSRADANGWSTSDAPLDVAPEAYRVTVYSGATPVRTIESSIPGALYTAAEQAADFGTPPTSFDFTIAQLSATLGPGHLAQGTFNA
jgi:hypothetical protein